MFLFGILASLLSYEMPEGDVYQSPRDQKVWAALNDSSYDGVRSIKRDSSDENHRYRLGDGLGVLVDRRVYARREIRPALEAPYSTRIMPWDNHQTLSGLVGWFCRSGLPLSPLSPPCQSRNVTLLFTFNSGKPVSIFLILDYSIKTYNLKVQTRNVVFFCSNGIARHLLQNFLILMLHSFG